jgi:hypothetical protein
MSQQELLKHVVEYLTQAGIEFMVTGSIASTLQGESRATHDIDLVVALPAHMAKDLAAAFPPPAFYLAEDSIHDAIRSRFMFNLISLASGDKVDFWLLTDEPFDQSRFARRYTEEFAGMRLPVSAPEDTILAKLRWAKLSGGSEKQFTDALRVYEVQFTKLDQQYLDQWAKQLGVESEWASLKAQARPI